MLQTKIKALILETTIASLCVSIRYYLIGNERIKLLERGQNGIDFGE